MAEAARRPEVALLVPIYGPALERLEREYTVLRAFPAADPAARLRDEAARARVLVTTGLAGFDAGHIDAMPALELVAVFGVGHGSLDLEAARARGVAVANTPDSTHAAVADLAVGLILALTRRILEADRFVRAGHWTEDGPFPLGRGLSGRRCGLLGYGRIGSLLAARLEAFGVDIAYHARHELAGANRRYFADLRTLAAWSEILVVACPLTEASRGIVDDEVIGALGADGFLVNVARGPIVERDALLTALRNRTLAGVGLDVYWNEPQVPPALLRDERVVLLPHLGTSTREIREERMVGLFANLDAFFAGRPLPTPVDA
jgi:hydroxypyruvate reductase